MAIYPDDDQIKLLLTMDMEEPVAMVNLLKFKEKAEYREGHEFEPCTGAEAYFHYSAALGGFPNSNGVLDQLGARILFAGPVQHGVIGTLEATAYDMIAIVRYPSRRAFIEMIEREDYKAAQVHRDAGLDHQLLISCQADLLQSNIR